MGGLLQRKGQTCTEGTFVLLILQQRPLASRVGVGHSFTAVLL